jgi:N-acetylglucosaminyl-diphospho-decaprenol L-rhamnosyltransferase
VTAGASGDPSIERRPAPGGVTPAEPSGVTVVVPSWNTADTTIECLRSLVAQRPPVEAILVDNASEDGTTERVRAELPGVTVLAHRRNRGFAAACNSGLRAAHGRAILFLNSDTTLLPDAIARMLAALEAEPGVGILGPRLRGRDGEVQPSVRTDPSPGALLHQHTALRGLRFLGAREARYKMRAFGLDRRADVEVVMGAALLARREALEAAGAFDEGYFMYFEEADLCRRVRRAGWRVVFDPSSEIVHLGRESARRAGAAAEAAYLRSLLRYVRRREGAGRGALFAALFLPAWALRRLGLVLRDAAGTVLGAAAGRGDVAARRAEAAVRGVDLLTRRLFHVVAGASGR